MKTLGLPLTLEDTYIRRVIFELKSLSGARFERFGYALIDCICAPAVMIHKGLNVEGAPVKKVIDSISNDTTTAAQYSSEADYFAGDATKPKNDYAKVKVRHPSANVIHLLSNEDSPVNVTSFMGWAVEQGKADHTTIETWDAPRIAKFMVNRLDDDSLMSALKEWLPCLTQFQREYSYSQMLPKKRLTYVEKEDETDLGNVIRDNEVTVLHGLSGVGKSDLACSLAWQLKSEFDAVIWLPADDIARTEDLGACSVHRYGSEANVLGMLESRKILLILDNVTVDLDRTRLVEAARTGSRILITQKHAHADGVHIEGLSQKQTAAMFQSIASGCSEDILQQFHTATGGHALTLAVLGKLASRFGWLATAKDLLTVGGATQAGSNVSLRNRVLGKAEELVPRELQFLKWCGSPLIDIEFAKHVLGVTGISNLIDLNLLRSSNEDVLLFHDLVFLFSEQREPDAQTAAAFEDGLVAHLQTFGVSKQLGFFLCIYRHHRLIARLVEKGLVNPVLLYALFSSDNSEAAAKEFVDRVGTDLETFAPDFQDVPFSIRAMALIEGMERNFLDARRASGDAARKAAIEMLPCFDLLLKQKCSTSERALILHHQAKALKRAGEHDKAQTIFEAIVNGECPLPQSRLQLARILERKGDGSNAAAQMIEILTSAEKEPGSVSVTTLLEVFGTLRHRDLLPFRDQLADRYSDIARAAIEETISTGFGQPFGAVAALASYWSEKCPSALTSILERLPEPPVTLLNDDGFRASIAEIYIHGAELLSSSNPKRAERLRKEAILLLSATKRPHPFYEHLQVRALIGLGRYSEGLTILDSRGDGDVIWKNVWLAGIFAGLGRMAEAEVCIAAAKAEAEKRSVRLWMVEHRLRDLFGIA